MTSQRDVEDFARWLWLWDAKPEYERKEGSRVPDNYLNEAANFLAGPLGQRLQHGDQPELDRLRAEIADRHNVEADLRAQVAQAETKIAAAWDEGRRVGIACCGTLWMADDPPIDPWTRTNPYRAQVGEESGGDAEPGGETP
jgi:hypothetical protein